jgi:hypothetical protein
MLDGIRPALAARPMIFRATLSTGDRTSGIEDTLMKPNVTLMLNPTIDGLAYAEAIRPLHNAPPIVAWSAVGSGDSFVAAVTAAVCPSVTILFACAMSNSFIRSFASTRPTHAGRGGMVGFKIEAGQQHSSEAWALVVPDSSLRNGSIHAGD